MKFVLVKFNASDKPCALNVAFIRAVMPAEGPDRYRVWLQPEMVLPEAVASRPAKLAGVLPSTSELWEVTSADLTALCFPKVPAHP